MKKLIAIIILNLACTSAFADSFELACKEKEDVLSLGWETAPTIINKVTYDESKSSLKLDLNLSKDLYDYSPAFQVIELTEVFRHWNLDITAYQWDDVSGDRTKDTAYTVKFLINRGVPVSINGVTYYSAAYESVDYSAEEVGYIGTGDLLCKTLK